MLRGEAKAMVVAGVMSGTSADGVDVALVRVSPGTDGPKVKVLGHASFPYPAEVRAAVLKAMDAKAISVAELGRLNWRLGTLYAECVGEACRRVGVKTAAFGVSPPIDGAGAMERTESLVSKRKARPVLELVGMHGQTIYHQGSAQDYLGAPVRATWQIGEAAVVAERLRVPMVSDFRPADLAAGGQGAPLVPMLDYTLFRDAKKNRVLLNLGGIANVSAIPAGAGLEGVLAFDTGPANMVSDALMERLYGKRFDGDGAVAAQGKVLGAVVDEVLRDPYFSALPPKSCGREEFGAGFVSRMHALCLAAKGRNEDCLATAAELTVQSVVRAYGAFCWSHLGMRAPGAEATEVIVAGGGVRNGFVMRRLREEFGRLGVTVLAMEEVGVAAEAKEAVAFGLLAWLTWFGLAGNVPSATGAQRAVVLGKVSFGS